MKWAEVPNFPLYEVNTHCEVREVLTGRILQTAWNNRGHHYHLESKSGRVIALERSLLMSWAFPRKEDVA